MGSQKQLDHKLGERILLARRKDGDRLMLSDATILAALDSRRPLTAAERSAIEQSPLTLRRFRQLAIQWRAGRLPAAAANEPVFYPSRGMLRQADSGQALEKLPTDDLHWVLHFIPEGDAWQVVLALDPEAPFAQRLMQEQPELRVLDGAGALILRGKLDADGECEARWPFAAAPKSHFHHVGGVFSVELA